jgi:arylsulfatase A
MKSATLSWIAILFALFWLADLSVARQPNIVFIMADDLGYAHLGCYGQRKIRTPNLDRMAAKGMRFTDVYAGACVCAPSRSVLMSGLHGGHAPVRGNSGGIPLAPEDVTVAELLKKAGYATGLFGKWGLGEHGTTGVPYKQGFDEFLGYLHQIHAHFYYPDYLWRMDRRYDLPGNRDGGRGQYAHDEIVAGALDFVRRHRAEPFFLYVPFAVPHYELLVPEESLDEYAGKFTETPYKGRGGKTGYPHDYATQAMPRAATAAIITHMDRSVGKIMSLVKELGLDDETIVFFTSDNGATSGPSDPEFFGACGPLRGVKGTLYEGGIRVPMIARWPKHVAEGVVNRHVWYFADVLPTLVELAGAKPPAGIDGISVVPALLGESAAGRKQPEHEFLYWEDGPDRAVRSGRWKAIRTEDAGGHVALYDLENDIGESRDVAADQPRVVARLSALLESTHTDPRPQIEPEKPAGRQFQ